MAEYVKIMEGRNKAAKKLKQPIVIDKVQAGPMTEDGRDWGERCVDMYKIVDKVSLTQYLSSVHHLPNGYHCHVDGSIDTEARTCVAEVCMLSRSMPQLIYRRYFNYYFMC